MRSILGPRKRCETLLQPVLYHLKKKFITKCTASQVIKEEENGSQAWGGALVRLSAAATSGSSGASVKHRALFSVLGYHFWRAAVPEIP